MPPILKKIISSPDSSEDEIPKAIFKQQTNYLLNHENIPISSTNDSHILLCSERR